VVPGLTAKKQYDSPQFAPTPLANEPDSDGHSDDWQSAEKFSWRFESVGHTLAHLRLRFGMLIPISLKVKFDLVKAASSRSTNVCGSVNEARREWRRLPSA